MMTTDGEIIQSQAIAHAWGVWLFEGEDGTSYLANMNLTPDDFESHGGWVKGAPEGCARTMGEDLVPVPAELAPTVEGEIRAVQADRLAEWPHVEGFISGARPYHAP